MQPTLFTYDAAGDLLTLTDPKNQVTTWGYDSYGRVTNKLDQAAHTVLKYGYDPDNRLTNRWSAAKGTTTYTYDPVGNLTNIAYPSSGTVKLAYDAMNRLTNMVDAVGTTRSVYDAAGQLLTTSGPFTSDTVSNAYSNRKRVALSLQQPSRSWTNGFGWDLAGRLTSVISPAGAFGYTYAPARAGFSGRLVQQLDLPPGAAITNYFDPVARLLGTLLQSSGGSTLDSAVYGYDLAGERTAYTNAAGTYVAYSYDPVGQLTVGDSSVSSENVGYDYDAAWNLHYRTNNGALTTFTVDSRNELTAISGYGNNYYDGNGNLTNRYDGLDYTYDDENRLVRVADDRLHSFRTDFVYDGLGRLRKRLEYTWSIAQQPSGGSASPYLVGSWNLSSTTLYLWDGMRVIQERNGSNLPQVSYTRGIDLSGSLQGAGGIGGLLARSSGYSAGSWISHYYYHADGNGNITCLIDGIQSVVASYRYDPYGNTISQSGSLAAANVYRFSSKEVHTNSLMYYYGYRFYAPNFQRWPNQDPMEEDGGINLYTFAANDSVNHMDSYGFQIDGIATPGITTVLMTPEELAAAQAAAARAAARLAAAAAAAASTSFCKAPKDPCKGLRDQYNAHLKKLQDYINDPEGHDNLGTLQNNPGLRERLIDGRIRASPTPDQ